MPLGKSYNKCLTFPFSVQDNNIYPTRETVRLRSIGKVYNIVSGVHQNGKWVSGSCLLKSSSGEWRKHVSNRNSSCSCCKNWAWQCRTHNIHTEASLENCVRKSQIRWTWLVSSGPEHGKILKTQHQCEYRRLMGTDFFSRCFATLGFWITPCQCWLHNWPWEQPRISGWCFITSENS